MENVTFEEEDIPYPGTETHPLDILNAATSLVSAIANVITIYVILRHSLLRTRSNLYLVNLSICNFLVMLLVPASLNLFGITDDLSYECMCGWEESLYGIMFGNSLFSIVLLVSWYMTSYVKRSCAVSCKLLPFFIALGAWVTIGSVSIASVSFCIQGLSYPVALACFIVGYMIMFVVMLVVYVFRFIKIKIYKVRAKSHIELIVISCYFLCWMPNWLSMYAEFFIHYSFSTNVHHLTYFVGYSFGWIMFVLLCYYNQTFRSVLKEMIGCSRDDSTNKEHLDKEQNAVLL